MYTKKAAEMLEALLWPKDCLGKMLIALDFKTIIVDLTGKQRKIN